MLLVNAIRPLQAKLDKMAKNWKSQQDEMDGMTKSKIKLEIDNRKQELKEAKRQKSYISRLVHLLPYLQLEIPSDGSDTFNGQGCQCWK